MDIASRALVEPLPDGISDTFPARAAHFDVPLATLYARASGRPSREAKAIDQIAIPTRRSNVKHETRRNQRSTTVSSPQATDLSRMVLQETPSFSGLTKIASALRWKQPG